MKLAAIDVNNNNLILPNTTLKIDYRNDDFQPNVLFSLNFLSNYELIEY